MEETPSPLVEDRIEPIKDTSKSNKNLPKVTRRGLEEIVAFLKSCSPPPQEPIKGELPPSTAKIKSRKRNNKVQGKNTRPNMKELFPRKLKTKVSNPKITVTNASWTKQNQRKKGIKSDYGVKKLPISPYLGCSVDSQLPGSFIGKSISFYYGYFFLEF